MTTVNLTEALKADYQRLFDGCNPRPDRMGEIEEAIGRIRQGKPRYQTASAATGVPWHVIAVIHQMECGGRFDQHLHNGDPLTARTVRVPANRPPKGNPPFTWEDSAQDALRLKRMDRWSDWTLPGILYKLEGYNGFGYRLYHPETPSPYLWAGSSHYSRGKYVQDGTWSPTAVSKQIGAAVLLRRMAETAQLEPATALPPIAPLPAGGEPLFRYDPATVHPQGAALQAFLNTLPNIYLKVDGKLGPRSSNALKSATGRYLTGDPRDGG